MSIVAHMLRPLKFESACKIFVDMTRVVDPFCWNRMINSISVLQFAQPPLPPPPCPTLHFVIGYVEVRICDNNVASDAVWFWVLGVGSMLCLEQVLLVGMHYYDTVISTMMQCY